MIFFAFNKTTIFLCIYQDFSAREIYVKFHVLEMNIDHFYPTHFYFYFSAL